MATDDAVQKSEVDEADGGTIPKHGTSGLLVLANRLPVRRVTSPEGTHWETSPGGLVTALSPVLSQRIDAMWLGEIRPIVSTRADSRSASVCCA